MKLKLLSTVAAVALLTTGLMAQSQLDISAGAAAPGAVDTPDTAGTASGPVTVAKEVLAGATADVNLATLASAGGHRNITYQSDIAMAQSATFEITMTNGAIKATGGNVLYFDDGAGEVARMTDFTTDANGNYTWMRFQITKAAGLASGAPISMYTTTAGADGDQPTIVVNKGLAKDAKVTAQVTFAKDDNGNSQNAPKTAAETLAVVVDGITAAVATPITNSVINVNDPDNRKKFVGSATTSTSTAVTIATNAAEVGLTLNAAADKYDLVVTRDNCSGLDDVAGSITAASGLAPADFNTTAECKWHWKGDFTDAMGTALAGAGETFTITVNGNDVLQTGTWKTTLKIQADEITPATTEVTTLDKADLIKWSINGAQFVVPYLNTQSAYGTYLVVTNTGDKDADMTMDVYADKKQKMGMTQSAMACQNVSLGTIPANSTATFYPADFNNAIDTTAGCANFSSNNDRFLGQFSVIAPDNSISAAAFQKDGANGKRSIPVLTTATHAWKE